MHACCVVLSTEIHASVHGKYVTRCTVAIYTYVYVYSFKMCDCHDCMRMYSMHAYTWYVASYYNTAQHGLSLTEVSHKLNKNTWGVKKCEANQKQHC